MSRRAELEPCADPLPFPGRTFFGFILGGAVLLAAVVLTFDRAGQGPLFLDPPYLFVSIIAGLLLWRLGAVMAGWLIGGEAPASMEITKLNAVLVGTNLVALIAFAVLAACSLLSLPFQADLAHKLFRAAICVMILTAMIIFLIPAALTTELVVERLRERRARRNAG